MLPYFLNLNKRIIDDELCLVLLDIANKNIKAFQDYRDQRDNEIDGNSFYYSKDLSSIPKIQDLKKSCKLNFYSVLLMHRPNIVVKKHKDDPNKRNCVLATPLTPKENYASTLFWSRESKDPVAVCDFPNFNSVFLNTQKIHSLKNYNVYRFNLQFCFDEPFEVVTDLYQNGQLFDN